jgi:hypothetical protein
MTDAPAHRLADRMFNWGLVLFLGVVLVVVLDVSRSIIAWAALLITAAVAGAGWRLRSGRGHAGATPAES